MAPVLFSASIASDPLTPIGMAAEITLGSSVEESVPAGDREVEGVSRKHFEDYFRTVLACLAHLCMTSERAVRPPRTCKSKRGAPRLPYAEAAKVVDVATHYASPFRADRPKYLSHPNPEANGTPKRAHIRGGHYRTIMCGPRNGPKYEVRKWIAPMGIHCDLPPDFLTVREVEMSATHEAPQRLDTPLYYMPPRPVRDVIRIVRTRAA